MVYRRGGGWKQVLGIAGLSAALAMGVIVYSGRMGESPDEMIERNSQVHRCDDPGCLLCEVNRDFQSRHPDANLGWPGQEIDGENTTVIRFVEPAPTD